MISQVKKKFRCMYDNGGTSISHRRKHQIIKDAFRVAIREIMKSHPNAR